MYVVSYKGMRYGFPGTVHERERRERAIKSRFNSAIDSNNHVLDI